MAFEKSKEIARSFKRELIVYQRVLRDERTPLSAKLFLALAIGYALPLSYTRIFEGIQIMSSPPREATL
jgi:hypothetical protein